MTITLTGGQAVTGNATNKNETDNFLVLGAGNVIVEPGGGSLTVNGGTSPSTGPDTATTIILVGVNSPAANQHGDKITINLDGSGNSIFGLDPGTGAAQLNNATIKITVSGPGTGGNLVGLNNNGGGHTSVSLTGGSNDVFLNGDATNTVIAGTTGDNLVEIGFPGDGATGFKSSVTLVGDGNAVLGGDSNITVTGGVNGNLVVLGNGNDTVNLTGSGNSIGVGGGQNQIVSTGGKTTLQITDNSVILGPTPTDNVVLGGAGNTVTEVSGFIGPAANITIAGSTGTSTFTLGNGNDNVTAGGNKNAITLGNGQDSVTANGNNNSITLGSGSNTVSATGTGDTITALTAGSGSTDSFMLGNKDSLTATGGVQNVTTGGNDTVTLNNTMLNSSVTLNGNSNSLTFMDSSGSVNVNTASHGNTIELAADAGGNYTGHITINGLGGGDAVLDLHGLGFPSGTSILFDALTHPVAGGYDIALQGGGDVKIIAGALSPTEFSAA